jgi:NADPH:quinone reductase-like Zn-dependent oxidoreductase
VSRLALFRLVFSCPFRSHLVLSCPLLSCPVLGLLLLLPLLLVLCVARSLPGLGLGLGLELGCCFVLCLSVCLSPLGSIVPRIRISVDIESALLSSDGSFLSFSRPPPPHNTNKITSSQSGEVLVKMSAAPVNPSDYGSWMRGMPGDLPKGIGNEGSGVVVASGGGMIANGLVGKKVGVVVQNPGQGSYSEYVTVDAMKGAFPLPEALPAEDGASFFINPYTVVGIVETAKATGSPGLVHTAGASQLGQMMTKLCKTQGYLLISVVRQEAQAQILRDLGADHVVVTGDGNEDKWQSELGGLIKDKKITCAFECISGDMTGQILSLLPQKGTLYLYGALTLSPPGKVDPMDLIYFAKKLVTTAFVVVCLCLSVCLYLCLSVCLSVCLSLSLSLCLSACRAPCHAGERRRGVSRCRKCTALTLTRRKSRCVLLTGDRGYKEYEG